VAEGFRRGFPVTTPAPERRPRSRGRFRAFRRDERGTALVEFALIAPLLFLLLFAILDFGRALDYYNQVTQLAGQGARAAAVNRNPDGTPITSASSLQNQLVQQYTAQPELKKGETVCITQVPQNVGDPVTVKVSYTFHFLPLVGAAGAALGGLTLSSTQTERAEAVPPSYGQVNQSGTPCS
jgi:Flp pilus assembly protein TadG